MRFKTTDGYRKALDIFTQLKCRMTEVAEKKASPASEPSQSYEIYNGRANILSTNIFTPAQTCSTFSIETSLATNEPGLIKHSSSAFTTCPESISMGPPRPSSTTNPSSSPNTLKSAGSHIIRPGTSTSLESYQVRGLLIDW